jgi:hypothetical protein
VLSIGAAIVASLRTADPNEHASCIEKAMPLKALADGAPHSERRLRCRIGRAMGSSNEYRLSCSVLEKGELHVPTEVSPALSCHLAPPGDICHRSSDAAGRRSRRSRLASHLMPFPSPGACLKNQVIGENHSRLATFFAARSRGCR